MNDKKFLNIGIGNGVAVRLDEDTDLVELFEAGLEPDPQAAAWAVLRRLPRVTSPRQAQQAA